METMKNTSKFTTYDDFKTTTLKDADVKAEYDALEDEFNLISELIKARTAKNLTQADLAEKTGLKQAAIARLESGGSNPSYKTLTKVAKALDKKVALV
jgi:DNA-binding XRE family transcriptional regulator